MTRKLYSSLEIAALLFIAAIVIIGVASAITM